MGPDQSPKHRINVSNQNLRQTREKIKSKFMHKIKQKLYVQKLSSQIEKGNIYFPQLEAQTQLIFKNSIGVYHLKIMEEEKVPPNKKGIVSINRRNRVWRDLLSLGQLKKIPKPKVQVRFVCCAQCGRHETETKMVEHWRIKHGDLFIGSEEQVLTLTTKPPPQPEPSWGINLLEEVGWRTLQKEYAKEKELYELQTKIMMVPAMVGFGTQRKMKAERVYKPPKRHANKGNGFKKIKGKRKIARRVECNQKTSKQQSSNINEKLGRTLEKVTIPAHVTKLAAQESLIKPKKTLVEKSFLEFSSEKELEVGRMSRKRKMDAWFEKGLV